MLAYLIRCTGDVARVPELMHSIYDSRNLFIVSISAQTPPLPLPRVLPDNVHVTTTHPTAWGGDSFIAAMLDGMRVALRTGLGWDYFVTLSETCVALRPQQELFDFLVDQRRRGLRDFLHYTGAAQTDLFPELQPTGVYETLIGLAGGSTLRSDVALHSYFSDLASSPIMRLELRASFFCYEGEGRTVTCRPLYTHEREARARLFRKAPARFGPYFCVLSRPSCWWLTHSDIALDCSQIIRSYLFPEESLFQSALLADGSGIESGAILNRNLHAGGGRPISVTDADLDSLMSSDAFFARKLTKGAAPAVESWSTRLGGSRNLFEA